jgi:hypothetical protein
LAEAENMAKNLSIALVELSVEIGEMIERVLILAGQLEEASLFLVMAREKEAIIALKNECIICHLITSGIRDNMTQTVKVIY